MSRRTRNLKTWGFAALAIAVLSFVAFGFNAGREESPDWMRFSGRFHVLLLHLPIVCLVLALASEIASRTRRYRSFGSVSRILVVVATVGAFVSVLTGSLLMAGEGHGGDLVDRHRLIGFLVAVFSIIATAFRISGNDTDSKIHSRGLLVSLGAACGLMVFAAHDGGSLVHGENYLVAYAPGWIPYLGTVKADPSSGSDSENDEGLVSLNSFAQYEGSIKSDLNRYCYRCHGDEDAEGGIRLDEMAPHSGFALNLENWNHVRDMLATLEMPPEDARAMPKNVRERVLAWVDVALEEAAVSKRLANGSFPMRRLSRREYQHSLQDLFNVSAAIGGQLPPDPISEKGYDTAADLLMISNVDLQLYLEVARRALDTYVHFGDRTSERERFFFELEDIYHFCRGAGYKRTLKLAPNPLSERERDTVWKKRAGQTPVFMDRKYGPLPFGEIPTGDVPGVGEGRGFARLHEQFVTIKTEQTVGEVVVRIHAAATPGLDGSYPILRLETGRSFHQSLKAMNVGEHDVFAEKGKPGVYEFRFRLEDALPPLRDWRGNNPGPYLLFVISNAARHEDGTLSGSRFGQGDTYTDGVIETQKVVLDQTEDAIESAKEGLARWESGNPNFLYLDAMEVEILPLSSDPKTPWIVDRPSDSADEEKIARQTLEQFIPIAFRRSTSRDEVDRFLSLYRQLLKNGSNFEEALKDVMSSVLISRSFLFIGHPNPSDGSAHQSLLASRLSYFIWSSIPDPRLVRLAESGELSDPKVLAGEVARMVESPKAARFVESFTNQWLGLEKMKDVAVSSELYPKFDVELSDLLKRQTIETVKDIFMNDRDARDLFRSHTMLLNAQLADHYGYDSITGGALRRVDLRDRAMNWGGILSHGSVMTLNSDGRDSHPIKRGVWLLEKVLDDPPPPPPPVVPEIDESDPAFKAMSLKDKIEHHREVHACSGCHGKIDPWGIPFEEYDATGRWRDTQNSARAIDASTVLPDGLELGGFEALSQHLLEDREEQMMLSLVKHMMTYALGRDLDLLDERESEMILRSFKISGYNLKHLALAIAQSDAFTQFFNPKEPHG